MLLSSSLLILLLQISYVSTFLNPSFYRQLSLRPPDLNIADRVSIVLTAKEDDDDWEGPSDSEIEAFRN